MVILVTAIVVVNTFVITGISVLDVFGYYIFLSFLSILIFSLHISDILYISKSFREKHEEIVQYYSSVEVSDRIERLACLELLELEMEIDTAKEIESSLRKENNYYFWKVIAAICLISFLNQINGNFVEDYIYQHAQIALSAGSTEEKLTAFFTLFLLSVMSLLVVAIGCVIHKNNLLVNTCMKLGSCLERAKIEREQYDP